MRSIFSMTQTKNFYESTDFNEILQVNRKSVKVHCVKISAQPDNRTVCCRDAKCRNHVLNCHCFSSSINRSEIDLVHEFWNYRFSKVKGAAKNPRGAASLEKLIWMHCFYSKKWFYPVCFWSDLRPPCGLCGPPGWGTCLMCLTVNPPLGTQGNRQASAKCRHACKLCWKTLRVFLLKIFTF